MKLFFILPVFIVFLHTNLLSYSEPVENPFLLAAAHVPRITISNHTPATFLFYIFYTIDKIRTSVKVLQLVKFLFPAYNKNHQNLMQDPVFSGSFPHTPEIYSGEKRYLMKNITGTGISQIPGQQKLSGNPVPVRQPSEPSADSRTGDQILIPLYF